MLLPYTAFMEYYHIDEETFMSSIQYHPFKTYLSALYKNQSINDQLQRECQ